MRHTFNWNNIHVRQGTNWIQSSNCKDYIKIVPDSLCNTRINMRAYSLAFAVNYKSTLQKNASIKASVTQWDTKSNLETLVNSWEDFQLDSSSCAPSQITVKLLSPLQQAYSTYLFRYVAWQPVETLIQTFSWGGTGALNVPVRNSHVNQFNLVTDTGDIRIYKFISTENFSIVTI